MLHPYVHARTTPDKPALICAGSGQIVTYRELDDRSNQVAQLFRSLGLQSGDHIALMLENHPRYFEICWGAQRAGLIYTAMSTRLTEGEVSYIVDDCGAKAVIASRAMGAAVQHLPAACKAVKSWLMLGGAIEGWSAYESAVDAQPVARIADEVLRDYLAGRFALAAGTRTTKEIVGDLLGVVSTHLDIGLVEKVGQDADLVKFARGHLASDQAHAMAGRVRALILATADRTTTTTTTTTTLKKTKKTTGGRP